ncbi:MAG TPA: M12 family metallo-peptidase, partial [Vicinamibacterales bacterium]|nr:M12 family metallo-peptidase [Vicinamibacterales bacterium]
QGPGSQAEVQFEGEFEAIYEDGPSGSRLNHFLALDEDPGNSGRGNANGRRRIRLEFTDGEPDVETGTRIRARGRMKNADTLQLSKSGSGTQVVSQITSNTFGEQKTIVLLVNFLDNPSAPYNANDAQAVNQTVADFYRESSFNQTSMNFTVAGWFTLNMNGAGCDYNSISSQADQKAQQSGINLGAYTRKVYAFPNIGCSWWGLGTVGGNPSRAWIDGNYALKVVAHELGHNFGLHHSHSVPCDTGGCSSIEYGDDRDMMGLSATGHFTAFQKQRLGWLAYGSSPAIQTASASGTYQIESFSSPSGGAPKAIKILKSVDGSGNKTWYYVEARTSYGFDGSVGSGVTVHTGADAVNNSSDQIDLDPVSGTFDSTLDAGQTFTDNVSGVSITTVWANASGAAVAVTVPSAPCNTGTPTVTLNPGGNVMTQPGSPVSFDVSVRNNDGSSCPDAAFDLTDAVPAGWSGVFSTAYVTLAPGATTSASLTVTPDSGASGPNGHTVNASRATGPNGAANGTITVVTGLDVGLTIGPGKGGATSMTATVSASGAGLSGATVVFRLTKPNGVVVTSTGVTNGTGVATYSFKPSRKDPSGTYQVTATTTANGMTATAAGSFVK